MAKLTQDIYAVPDGELHPQLFRAGQNVSGSVEDAAREQGKLEKAAPSRKAATVVPETK